MSALNPILAYKREEVVALKANHSFSDLSAQATEQSEPRGFAAALQRAVDDGKNGLICELKRKSPSAGEIHVGADPIDIAKEYQSGGAACLSVLTDKPSFGGSLEDLRLIKKTVDIPILRKDFMIDPIQIVEARANGADAILIIMAAVDDVCAKDLSATAYDLNMDALIEVHNEEELDRALKLSIGLLGINNRDLTEMKTNLSVTERLSKLVPDNIAFVSESGVKTEDDISRLKKSGAHRFLIGESLMLANERKQMVSQLKLAGTV